MAQSEPAQSELAQLMEKIGEKYAVETVPLRIGGRELKILQFEDFESHIEELIEKKGVAIKDLPFWAKVWDSSFMLALYLGKLPVEPGQRILEIGAGIGVVGIYAALCGHDTTLSDIDEDSLRFCRANALLNGLPHLRVERIDWNSPDLTHPYEVIVGSEIVYDRSTYGSLVEFLRKALAPNGVIFLAKNAQLPTPTFFPELTKYFKFKQTTQKIFLEGEAMDIVLYAVRHK